MAKATKQDTVVKVKIEKSKKLTATEINALVEVTIERINNTIDKRNKASWESPEYKAQIKALKTKHGLLKAEKELIKLKQSFPDVDFSISYSSKYSDDLRTINNKHRNEKILPMFGSYNSGMNASQLKHKLILEQVDNNLSVFELADKIAQEYLNK